MKSRDTVIRLKRFQLEEKRRRVRQIEPMVGGIFTHVGELDREIANEEKRAGISDPAPFRLSDLRPRGFGAARQPQELDRRIDGAARRREGRAGGGASRAQQG